MARHWVLLKYMDAADGGTGTSSGSVFTDYFSGLKPSRLAFIHDGGTAKVDAIREKYRIKADDLSIRNTGYFSDHCFKTKFDEEALLFSILLTDDIALQAFADYGLYEDSDVYVEGSPHVPGDPIPRRTYDRLPAGDKMSRPIKAVYLQTTRLADGAIIDGPKSVAPLAIERTLGAQGLSLAVIGSDERSPIALAFSSLQFVAVVTRTGQIPVFRKVRCDNRYAIDVRVEKESDGASHLLVTERRTNRNGDISNWDCHAGVDLEREANLVEAFVPNPPSSTESHSRD